MCAVDECGVCTGSNDCPLVMQILFDYPYVTPVSYEAGRLESSMVTAEIMRAVAQRIRVPLPLVTLELLEPQVDLSAPTDIRLQYTVTAKGCVDLAGTLQGGREGETEGRRAGSSHPMLV